MCGQSGTQRLSAQWVSSVLVPLTWALVSHKQSVCSNFKAITRQQQRNIYDVALQVCVTLSFTRPKSIRDRDLISHICTWTDTEVKTALVTLRKQVWLKGPVFHGGLGETQPAKNGIPPPDALGGSLPHGLRAKLFRKARGKTKPLGFYSDHQMYDGNH